MKRREFISLLGGAAAVWPLAARAQQPEQLRRIAVFMDLAESDPEGQARVAALKRGLHHLGWIEGRNLRIESRWAAGEAARMRPLAEERSRLFSVRSRNRSRLDSLTASHARAAISQDSLASNMQWAENGWARSKR